MLRLLAFVGIFAVATGARAQDTIVIVSDSDCRWLERHVPAADATYTPGRDVHGREVAPADLPGSSPLNIPTEIPIRLTIPLWKFLGSKSPPLLSGAEVDAGTVTVNRETGAVLYNGVPVSGAGQGDLVAACKERRQRQKR